MFHLGRSELSWTLTHPLVDPKHSITVDPHDFNQYKTPSNRAFIINTPTPLLLSVSMDFAPQYNSQSVQQILPSTLRDMIQYIDISQFEHENLVNEMQDKRV